MRALIGTQVSNERIVEIFRTLHLKADDVTETGCVVTAPLFRLDLEREADLIEEVARIDGLDRIPEIAVTGKICGSIREDAYLPLETLRNKIISLGFYECLHYSTVNRESALSDSRFTESDLIRLKNPISLELAIMRPSLLGEMLGTIERNISRRNLTLKLFETGKAFCRNPELFPEERFELCMALTGLKHPEQYSDELKAQYDFYDMKGALESLFELMNIRRYRFVPVEDGRFRKGRAAEVQIEGEKGGRIRRTCAVARERVAHDLSDFHRSARHGDASGGGSRGGLLRSVLALPGDEPRCGVRRSGGAHACGCAGVHPQGETGGSRIGAALRYFRERWTQEHGLSAHE